MTESLWDLMRSASHWEFELLLMVVFDGIVLGICWPFLRKHWLHHLARDRQDWSMNPVAQAAGHSWTNSRLVHRLEYDLRWSDTEMAQALQSLENQKLILAELVKMVAKEESNAGTFSADHPTHHYWSGPVSIYDPTRYHRDGPVTPGKNTQTFLYEEEKSEKKTMTKD